MREKEKQEEAPPTKSIEEPTPIDEDSFARRAGEIIARAAGARQARRPPAVVVVQRKLLDGNCLSSSAIRCFDIAEQLAGTTDDDDAPASQVGDGALLSGDLHVRGSAALNGICRETGKQDRRLPFNPIGRAQRCPTGGIPLPVI